jgi:hypothetical protein
MAIGATGTALAPTLTSGLGNIQTAVGTPNASGGAAAANGINNRMGTMGNVGNAIQQAPPQQSPQQATTGPAALHPNAIRDLKNLPPGLLQHLHDKGVIHPGLMAHINGSTT